MLDKLKQIHGQAPGPHNRTSLLSTLRTLGEYYYSRGEAYKSAERPEPIDPEAVLQKRGAGLPSWMDLAPASPPCFAI